MTWHCMMPLMIRTSPMESVASLFLGTRQCAATIPTSDEPLQCFDGFRCGLFDDNAIAIWTTWHSKRPLGVKYQVAQSTVQKKETNSATPGDVFISHKSCYNLLTGFFL